MTPGNVSDERRAKLALDAMPSRETLYSGPLGSWAHLYYDTLALALRELAERRKNDGRSPESVRSAQPSG